MGYEKNKNKMVLLMLIVYMEVLSFQIECSIAGQEQYQYSQEEQQQQEQEVEVSINAKEVVVSSALPIDSSFKFPAPLPVWPTTKGNGNGGFGSGVMDLGGGLQVAQVTSFKKIWSSDEGGPENMGVTLFEPWPIPEGFAMLGSYGQANNRPLSGWVLVGGTTRTKNQEEEEGNSASSALANPVDYALVWSQISQRLNVSIWLPIPPEGYRAVGYVVSVSVTSPELSEKAPALDRVRCVRADLTEQSEPNAFIWESNEGLITIHTSRPLDIGVAAASVPVGTFIARNSNNGDSNVAGAVSCLKNSNDNLSSLMPDMGAQIKALIETYAPRIYLHPDDEFRPSTVNWLFENGALVYNKSSPYNPVPAVELVQPDGSNLPQGGSNDGTYWLDLPRVNDNDQDRERVKSGDLNSCLCYIHVKPMLGGTHTDLATWVFYPFNGPARAKLKMMKSVVVSLGKIGEHVGDWEHVTLRISNLDGQLRMVYYSQHAGGVWVEAPDVEFESDTTDSKSSDSDSDRDSNSSSSSNSNPSNSNSNSSNSNSNRNRNRVVAYSALHSHAMYQSAGTTVRGGGFVGIRDEAVRGTTVLDCGNNRYELITSSSDEYWLNYAREWGPKISYDVGEEIGKLTGLLPRLLRREFDKALRNLPPEAFGEQGPTGPKFKPNWLGDEC